MLFVFFCSLCCCTFVAGGAGVLVWLDCVHAARPYLRGCEIHTIWVNTFKRQEIKQENLWTHLRGPFHFILRSFSVVRCWLSPRHQPRACKRTKIPRWSGNCYSRKKEVDSSVVSSVSAYDCTKMHGLTIVIYAVRCRCLTSGRGMVRHVWAPSLFVTFSSCYSIGSL